MGIFVGQNALSTAGSGTIDLTSPDSSDTPVAALHFVTGAIANNTSRNDAHLGIGMADGTNEFVGVGNSDNADTIVDAVSGRVVSSLALLNGGAQIINGQHNHSSFISGGQRVTDVNGFNVAYLCNSMFFAGMNARVREVTLNATVDVAVNVDPGIPWDVVIVNTNHVGTGLRNDAEHSIGFMVKADDAQGSMIFNANNGAASGDVSNHLSNVYAGGVTAMSTGAIVYGVDVQAGSGTSCDVIPRIAGGESDTVRLLFLEFTDSTIAKIVEWNSLTAIGNNQITGVGLSPSAMLSLISYCAAYNVGEGDADGGAMGIGIETADSQFALAYLDQNATGGNTVTNSYADNISIRLPRDDDTTANSFAATLSGFGSDDFTHNFSIVDTGTARKFLSLLFGSPPGAVSPISAGGIIVNP